MVTDWQPWGGGEWLPPGAWMHPRAPASLMLTGSHTCASVYKCRDRNFGVEKPDTLIVHGSGYSLRVFIDKYTQTCADDMTDVLNILL